MNNWYDEPEFQDWLHLYSYYGVILDFEFYYRFEEHAGELIKVRFRDEVAGAESLTDDGFKTIDEAREYVEQYKEKLMKLAAYEEQLDF